MECDISSLARGLYRDLEMGLNQKLNQINQEAGDQEAIKGTAIENDLNLLSLVAYSKDHDSPLTVANELCAHLAPNYVPDAASQRTGSFMVGPAVIFDPSANKGITFHELGHRLSFFLRTQAACADSTARYHSIRACLASEHIELTESEKQKPNASVFPGESQYEEEDWADLISATSDDAKTNFACFFFDVDSPRTFGAATLRNLNPQDTHSSPVFRLLHVQFLKHGSIPQVCTEALADKGQKPAFKNCLTSNSTSAPMVTPSASHE